MSWKGVAPEGLPRTFCVLYSLASDPRKCAKGGLTTWDRGKGRVGGAMKGSIRKSL